MTLNLQSLAYVAAGGALGAGGRYLAGLLIHSPIDRSIPWATMSVNVLGSFLIGYLFVMLPEAESGDSMMRLFLITGVLGGFTTYSAFSIETLQLMQQGAHGRALIYVLLTLLLCLLAVWLGFIMSKSFHH